MNGFALGQYSCCSLGLTGGGLAHKRGLHGCVLKFNFRFKLFMWFIVQYSFKYNNIHYQLLALGLFYPLKAPAICSILRSPSSVMIVKCSEAVSLWIPCKHNQDRIIVLKSYLQASET